MFIILFYIVFCIFFKLSNFYLFLFEQRMQLNKHEGGMQLFHNTTSIWVVKTVKIAQEGPKKAPKEC